MLEDGYCPCATCGVWVDDGSVRNGKYLCHDCMDNLMEQAKQSDKE